MIIEPQLLRSIIESALMAYGQPLTIEKLQTLFVVEDKKHEEVDDSKEAANDAESDKDAEKSDSYGTHDVPTKEAILEALEAIEQSCEGRGFELKKVSSGWRFQVRADMANWVNRLWEEKPQRYSRALLETLSIIAYRQPITRGDIEEIRGVAVSSHIIKTLTEREWIKVVGHRDVPGRPSLFATTRQFLDYFNLESLEELPSLRELADIESLSPELDLQAEQPAEGQGGEKESEKEGEQGSEENTEQAEANMDAAEASESNETSDVTEPSDEQAELLAVEEHDEPSIESGNELERLDLDEEGEAEQGQQQEPEQNNAADDVDETHLEDSLRSE